MIQFKAARVAAAALGVLLAGTLAVTPARAETTVIDQDATRAEALRGAAVADAFQDTYIGDHAPIAQRIHTTYDIPASVTLAQSILESNWGRSTLAAKERNYFGFKCSSPAGPGPIASGCARYPTTECVPAPCHPADGFFRSYAVAEDSFRDYGRLLTTSGYYAAALPLRGDPNAFIQEVAKKYATDPDYAGKIIRLIDAFTLRRFDPAPPAP